MRKIVLLAGLVLCLSAPALAQNTPQVEVLAGYSYIRSDGANFNGWNAAVAANFNDWFGLVADASGHYFPPGSINLYTYTFGPQISYRQSKRWTPFVHALFGGARTSGGGSGGTSFNGFAMNLGGGLDWNATDHFAFRLVQADLLLTRFAGSTSRDPRLSAGFVFRFGRRK